MEPEDRCGDYSQWRRCASREVLEETGVQVDPGCWLDGGERTTPPMFPVLYRTAFLVAELPAGDEPAPLPVSPENESLLWIDPADALQRYDTGEIDMPPPVLAVLRGVAADPPTDLVAAAELVRVLNSAEEEAPRIEFVPGIWMLPVHSDTLPPATHTNVYLPAAERFAVIDPGSSRPAELDRLLGVIDRLMGVTGATPYGVLLTHHHQDHSAGAIELAKALQVPVFAHPEAPCPTATEPLQDRLPVDLGGMTLVPVLTPGHAPGHLAFHIPCRNVLISGDLVSAYSTMLIPPESGAMDRYIASLALASKLGAGRLLPSHGPPLPAKALTKTAEHRFWRENRILEVLEQAGRKPVPLARISSAAYSDSPAVIRFLTEQQSESHLLRLEGAGRVRRSGGDTDSWELCHPAGQ
jgi:glyoxylase-like metal-dependent hydrolase (beta-lactamase superfamily II)